MSENISHAEYLSGKLFIDASVVPFLRDAYKRNMAEINFLDSDDLRDMMDGTFEILQPCWSGECSGWTYGDTLSDILKHTTGEADIVFFWRDSVTGLRVRDGKVEERKVRMVME